jgi:hypothetical protein
MLKMAGRIFEKNEKMSVCLCVFGGVVYLFIGWGRCQIFGYGLWVE